MVLDICINNIAFNCTRTYLTKFVALSVLYFCAHHLGNELVEVETVVGTYVCDKCLFIIDLQFVKSIYCAGYGLCRSQQPRGLRRGPTALAFWECGFESRRIMEIFCCECCVLSGIGLCVRPIARPEEVYRECVCVCVFECDRETP